MSSTPGRPRFNSDPARTKSLTNHLIRQLQTYVTANPTTTSADLFMAAHNFHKLAVLAEARRLGLSRENRLLYFAMAVETLQQALLREHERLAREEPDGRPERRP